METVQLTITDGVKNYLQAQATKHGLSSPTDYLQSVLSDLELRVNEKKEPESSLLESLRSPGIVADAAFWAERRRKVLDKHPELEKGPITAMQTIAIQQADGHLAEIIEKLPPGEEIVLTRADKPVATLRATSEPPRLVPQLGTMKGTVLYIAPDFDDIPEGFEEYLP